ncbi:hypothetical protein LWP59_28120 [Amycolatopsis acidiphila]|uniref:Uncharacterized protein n=1 Tax=Amycolatopsis acidiphila TaxID=715473 RepID=A0A558ADG7_9PSEU|nr:hypothetical protein [Amycolatopsis acidiphila]TVT22309.1 hypothetical protein FNH06_14125 [Amycolatopsis acidiphila]UIJ57976.1 hypothetical protein LWP59_28120 [Amycolatopsis acidiphila]
MVLAISFVEAPLKFRAPGVTIPIGLGIGRIVFRALNGLELLLAIVVVVAVLGNSPSTLVLVSALVPVGVLVVQLAAVRPALNRRSDRVLAGEDAPRSRAHLGYVALEVVKVAALLWLGVGASIA